MKQKIIITLLIINALLLFALVYNTIELVNEVKDTKETIVNTVEQLSIETIKERTDEFIFKGQEYLDSLKLNNQVNTLMKLLKPININ